MFLYITASACETRLTGFLRVLCDANMLVPDAQQPPADQDNDNGDNGDLLSPDLINSKGNPPDALLSGW